MRFKTDLLDDNGKHIYQLITTTRAGEYKVICKYKEFNICSKQKGTAPMHYIQTIQIHLKNEFEQLEVYQISTSSRNPHINSVVKMVGDNQQVIKINTFEYDKFEYILKELKPSLSKCVWDYIMLALNIVDSYIKINDRPECVEMIAKYLNNIDQKQIQSATKC